MISHRVSNAWKPVNNIHTKNNGTWKSVIQVYTKVNGTWKSLWAYKWTTGAWSNCSATCGNGTQTRTVVCTKQNGTSSVTVNDSLCTKFVGAKPSTSQTCTNGPCTECKHDSKHSYTTYSAPQDQSLSYTRFTWNGTEVGFCTPACTTVYKDGYKYSTGGQVGTDGFNMSGFSSWGNICRTPV